MMRLIFLADDERRMETEGESDSFIYIHHSSANLSLSSLFTHLNL